MRSVGLSPRVRGNLIEWDSVFLSLRSIPASAGEPYWLPMFDADQAVYPRECGGTYKVADLSDNSVGLSPRVRGNLVWRYDRTSLNRSIPASAGEPPSMHEIVVCVTGLSPRVRGNLLWPGVLCWCNRSIPASAGEPPIFMTIISGVSVYPRECGGTACQLCSMANILGLSPRVRGNHDYHWHDG